MASCVGRRDSPANVVRFGGIWPRNANDPTLIRIGKIEYHPMYNKTTKDHNFAIVTLVSAYEPNWSIFPGCIWLNETHFPAHQKLWVERKCPQNSCITRHIYNCYILYTDTKGFYDIYQMYHGDCEAYLKRSVADSEACMFRKRWTCDSYYNPILKEASPKCVFHYKDALLHEIKLNFEEFKAPIVSYQLDKSDQTIEYFMSNFDNVLHGYVNKSFIINTAQRIAPEKDWIVSVVESNT